MRLVAPTLLVLAAAGPARASVVEELSPARLYAEAQLVVDAGVVATWPRWNATHTGIETVAILAVTGTIRGAPIPTVSIVIPGGALDGVRHIVVGAPEVALGERARWFLRDRGDGQLAIYGWGQGKWHAAGPDPQPQPQPFTTNGMVWPASRMPVPYKIQNAGSDDLQRARVIAATNAAFATWQAVPCASLTFQNAGMTDLGVAIDGENVILFIESGWIYGAEAAAATSLYIIDGQQTADIALNGERWTWAIDPPGSSVLTMMDLQGVLTHEIGHFSGLGHSDRGYDTMYYSWKPWPGQRTLSIDDKLGLCSIYPVAGDECPTPACPGGETCTDHPLGRLCEGTPDPIGSPCNYDRVECDNVCLFTSPDLSTGYCSRFCDTDADCPLTHHCADASAGGMTVRVCFDGAQSAPDAGPLGCTSDVGCPSGQHCDPGSATCTFDCRTDDDCDGSLVCDERGFCASGGGGCGCRGDDRGQAATLLLAGVLLLVGRRHRKRPGAAVLLTARRTGGARLEAPIRAVGDAARIAAHQAGLAGARAGVAIDVGGAAGLADAGAGTTVAIGS